MIRNQKKKNQKKERKIGERENNYKLSNTIDIH